MDTQNKVNFKSEIIAKNYLKDFVENYLIDLIEEKFPGYLIYKSPQSIKNKVKINWGKLIIKNEVEDVFIEIYTTIFQLFITFWKFDSKDKSYKHGRMTVLNYNEILCGLNTKFVIGEIYNNFIKK